MNRQRDRYAREGVDLSLSTLADQVGACTVALRPLHDLIAAHVLAAERLHGDDTPVPVLAKGKTATARAWAYALYGTFREHMSCQAERHEWVSRFWSA